MATTDNNGYRMVTIPDEERPTRNEGVDALGRPHREFQNYSGAWVPETLVAHYWVPDDYIKWKIQLKDILMHPYAAIRLEFMNQFMKTEVRQLSRSGDLYKYLMDFEKEAREFRDLVFQRKMEELGADDKMKREDWGKYISCVDAATIEASTRLNMEMLHATYL